MFEFNHGSSVANSWTVKQVNNEIIVHYVLCVMWMHYHTFSFQLVNISAYTSQLL